MTASLILPHELQHRNQGQSPGGFHRSPVVRKERGKRLILVDRSQGIAELHQRAALRIGCAGNANGFFGNAELVLTCKVICWLLFLSCLTPGLDLLSLN